MAEVNAKDLTTKTAPASTDSMLLFGTSTNEGAKITVDNLANNILERLTTKTFANQVGGSSAATILAQLATLNSNLIGTNMECTPESGFTLNGISGAIVGRMAYMYIDIKGTISARTWTDVGTLPVAARPQTVVHALILLRSNGNPGGMMRINGYGKIAVFTTTAIDASDFAAFFVYRLS